MLTVVIIAYAMTAPLRAQRVEVQVDGGIGRLSTDVRHPWSFGYLRSALRVSGEWLSWMLQGSLAQEADVDPAAYIATGLGVSPTGAPGWRTDLQGGIGGTLAGSGTSRLVTLRQSVPWGGMSWFAGGAVGDTRRTETTSANTSVDVGVTMPAGPHLITFEAHQYRTADWPLLENAGYYLLRPAKAYNVGELSASIRFRPGPVELLLWGGRRTGLQATYGASTSYGASALIALAREGALVLSAGRHFADLMRGTPEGLIVNGGVRWQWASRAQVKTRRSANAPDIEALLERDDAGRTVLVLDVRAPAGARVEFGASFQDWTPVEVPRSGTRFQLRVQLPAGNHRVAVRINGGAWQSPVGLPRIDDDLDGEAGLVVVPASATS